MNIAPRSLTTVLRVNRFTGVIHRQMSGEWGSGAGKGGGSGGAVREAGGAFGKAEAAREEEFFRRQQREELLKLRQALEAQKQQLDQQIKHHETELEKLKNLTK